MGTEQCVVVVFVCVREGGGGGVARVPCGHGVGGGGGPVVV